MPLFRKSFTGMALLLLFANAGSYAQKPVAASFLKSNPSVRSLALGQRQITLRGRLESFTSNPASLTALKVPELMVSHSRAIEETSETALLFGGSFKNQKLATSLAYFNDGTGIKTGITENGDAILNLGEFRFSTFLFELGWATTIKKNVSFGVAAKGWQENKGGPTEAGWATDWGLQIPNLYNKLDIGLRYRNLGPNIDGKPIPGELAFGTAIHFPLPKTLSRFSLYSELGIPREQDTVARLGLEWTWDSVQVRSGYESGSKDLDEPLSQFAFGLGFQLQGWLIDYAWRPRGAFQDEHKIALSFGFGLTDEEKKQAAQKLDKLMESHLKKKADASYKEGLSAMKEKRYEEAIGLFSNALNWAPSHTKAKKAKAEALKKFNQQEFVRHYQLGQKKMKTKQWLEAAFSFRQALKIGPDSKKARQALKQAEKNMNRGSRKSTSSKNDKKFNQAVAHYLNGRHEAALKLWNQILAEDPTRPNLVTYIENTRRLLLEKELKKVKTQTVTIDKQIANLERQAYTFYKLRQTKKAIELWNKILVLDPKNADAREALRKVQAGKDLWGSDNVSRLDEMALEAYQAGDVQKAIRLWKKALQYDPQNKWIQEKIERAQGEVKE